MTLNRKLCNDDLRSIMDFCSAFKIKNTKPLLNEINSCLTNYTLDGEKKITKELCYLFTDERNNILKHSFWDKFKEKAGRTAYDIDFEMSIEDTFK